MTGNEATCISEASAEGRTIRSLLARKQNLACVGIFILGSDVGLPSKGGGSLGGIKIEEMVWGYWML